VNVRNAYLVSSLGHAGVLALGFALANLVHTPAIVPGVHIVFGGAGAPAGGGRPAESKVTPKPPVPIPKPKQPVVEPPPPQKKKVEDKAPPQREAAKSPDPRGTRPPRDAGIVSKAPSPPVAVAPASTSPTASSAANVPGNTTRPGSGRAGTGEVGVEAEGQGETGPAAGYLSLLRERVATAWEPPPTIDRAGEARVVVVFTVLAAGGKPEEISVQSSSGVSLFDRKAWAAVMDAAPLPPIPTHLGFGSFVIRFTFTQQY